MVTENYAYAAQLHHKPEGFFQESEGFLRRCGRLLPESTDFVRTKVSEKWCSIDYGSSGTSFRPSGDAVVTETWTSDGKVSESRHQV